MRANLFLRPHGSKQQHCETMFFLDQILMPKGEKRDLYLIELAIHKYIHTYPRHFASWYDTDRFVQMADPVCLEICRLRSKYGHFVWSVVSNCTKLQCWRICTEKNYILGFMRRCRYEEVIKACALDVDIQGMQGNDLAEIGEQGLNLSGGQRARLALARYVTLENFLLFLSEVLHWKLLLRRRLFNEN